MLILHTTTYKKKPGESTNWLKLKNKYNQLQTCKTILYLERIGGNDDPGRLAGSEGDLLQPVGDEGLVVGGLSGHVLGGEAAGGTVGTVERGPAPNRVSSLFQQN